MKYVSATQLSCLFRVFALIMAAHVSFPAYAQNDVSYSFLVAGHAYGAHAGTNPGLHPPFLKKLQEEKDAAIEGLFLTGDIVNTSTAASWAEVEKELSELGLTSYYIMGNHDNNTIGKAEFIKKHGGLYYYFNLHNDLYIILNSTESDRSISTAQLAFLTDVLQKASSTNNRVFIFFHEVIWNSAGKYRLVRSNSRSRYDQIRSVSNFWQKVVPILDIYPEKNFYLFSGDVGGNPDAIAAFYDQVGHMTLLSSGMGEVPDENYMKVNVSPDTITFKIIPLNDAIKTQPVTWYSIPATPLQLTGPSVVNPPQGAVRYEVSPVFNADTYKWTYTGGITGNNDTTFALLSFGSQYQTGTISVKAVKDGFGESDPVSLNVNASGYTSVSEIDYSSSLKIVQNEQYILLNYNADNNSGLQIKIFNLTGKLLYDRVKGSSNGLNTISIDKNSLGKGFVILDIMMDDKHLNKKLMLY
ncbi:MAG: metallophosphoesterase [Candidatus Saccharibacteria bacterium]